jgi:hypothetical protein
MASGRTQCVQQEPPPVPLPATAGLQRQTFGIRLAPAQLLAIKGQL